MTGHYPAGGLTYLVLLAAVLPDYNRRDCRNAVFYDTTDCRQLRIAGISMTIGATAATIAGIALLANRHGGRNSGGYSPPSRPPAPRPLPERIDTPGPFGAGYDEARRAIDEINAQVHGTVPPPQVVGSCSGSATTTVEITNATTYLLSVYLAGPQGQTLTIGGGQTISLRLAAGRYSVGARVNAANVVPFSGQWDLEGGCAHRSQFYIQ